MIEYVIRLSDNDRMSPSIEGMFELGRMAERLGLAACEIRAAGLLVGCVSIRFRDENDALMFKFACPYRVMTLEQYALLHQDSKVTRPQQTNGPTWYQSIWKRAAKIFVDTIWWPVK